MLKVIKVGSLKLRQAFSHFIFTAFEMNKMIKYKQEENYIHFIGKLPNLLSR